MHAPIAFMVRALTINGLLPFDSVVKTPIANIIMSTINMQFRLIRKTLSFITYTFTTPQGTSGGASAETAVAAG
jgi:hypothetical protein